MPILINMWTSPRYFTVASTRQSEFTFAFVHRRQKPLAISQWNKFCFLPNSIEWPLEAGVPVEQCLRVYKSSFLLNRLNDAAFGRIYIPAAKFMLMIFFINVPAFAVFCYWDKLELLSISTLIVSFGAALPLLVSGSLVMSGIYDISSQFQGNMGKKIQPCGTKRMRGVWMRELRSCQLVRCQIGNLYHMEGKAKLTLMDKMTNIFIFMVVQRELE